MDEDVTHFLDMLDAATERVFEAYTGKMAAESCTVAVPQYEQIVQHSANLQQGKELSSQLSLRNTPPFQAEVSSSLYEPQNRRKRCRTSEQPGVLNLVSNQTNVGLTDKNLFVNSDNHFISWPQNFTFQSSGVNKSVGGFELKQSSFSVKNHNKQPKRLPSRIQRNLTNTGVFDFDRINAEAEKKEMEKPADISKGIEEAINRIESLIPSLQKLVNSVHSPEQDSVTGNETGQMKNLAAIGETMVDKQASPMLTNRNLPVPSQVKWSRDVNCADDHDMPKQSKNTDIGWSNVNKTQKRLEKSPNVNSRIGQVPETKVKAGMGRSESLKGTLSSTALANQNPVQFKGSRIMPNESSCEEAIEKDVSSRPWVRVPSAGPTNFMRHNRTSNVGSYDPKLIQSRTMIPLDTSNRNAAFRKNMNEASNGKVGSDDQTSDETSWSTCASSSATTQQSGSTYSSSGTYESSGGSEAYDSDESEPQHETVGRSTRRKQAQVITDSSASAYDYITTSSYNSRDEYSDVGASSQMSSTQSHKWNLQKKERGKRKGGRLRRLGRKLGMIFHHHHHHHHHHYRDKDEHDARHATSIWARLGEMFHHTKNDADHRKETKAEKPRKSELKTLVVKRKTQGGQFHALVDGLMKHMKHSKKPKQIKNSTKELRNAHHGGKNLPWWPKIRKGRGGVKISNKGKVKLGNYRTKSMAAAKFVLGK